MPLKSKVMFTEGQSVRKEPPPSSPPGSNNGVPPAVVTTAASKRKSKKLDGKIKAAEVNSDAVEEDSYNEEYSPTDVGVRPKLPSETPVLIIADPDMNGYGGSISDLEIPPVQWPPTDAAAAATTTICAQTTRDTKTEESAGDMGTCNNVAGRMTTSQKITPCMKSDNQNFSTTDYATAAAPSFVPMLIHPINGQVSTFIRHREFTDYLRSSGCLRLFGTCILNVYRMKTWPASENLMEHLLNAMGHEILSRKQGVELNKLKHSLTLKLKELIKERCQLLEKLDEYQGTPARYELLDQDEILPPRPENTPLNMDLMRETFRNEKFISGEGDEESTSREMPVIISKVVPALNTLKIPFNDKRMLH